MSLPLSARRSGGAPVISAAGLLAIISFAEPARAHEGVIHIGRTDSGAIAIADFNFGDLFTLDPAALPLAGWASHTPHFEAIEADDPAAGIFALDTAAKISIEVILFSPALKLWNHELDHSISEPGERLGLGPLPFTEHTTWQVDAEDPAFDPFMTEWTATFRLVDAGPTAYEPTDAHTLRFTIPAPSTALAPLVLLALPRRRGR